MLWKIILHFDIFLQKYAEGHSIFYDFMGLFFIYYTETQGQIINCCVSVIVAVLIGISFWRMAATSYLSIGSTMKTFVLIEVLHILGIVLALGLPLLMAVMFDAGDRSMTWFSQKWLVFGLYVCPSLIGLCLPTLLYLSFNKNVCIFMIWLHFHNRKCVIVSSHLRINCENHSKFK